MSAFLRAVKAAFFSFITYVRHLSRRTLLIISAIVVVLLIVVSFMGKGETTAPINTTRNVELRSVAELSSESSGLALGGTVSSKSEATVRTEKAGEVRAVHYQLGDSVGAGAVVAEIENASERAAVLQAQAGVEAAQASAESSGAGFTGAKSGAVNALLTAYAAAENSANVGGANLLFYKFDATPVQYGLRVQSDAAQAKKNAENLRAQLDPVLERHNKMSVSLSENSNLTLELNTTEAELRQVRSMLDSTLEALNKGKTDNVVSETDLTTYKESVVAQRSSVTTALSGITTARQSLASAEANSSGGSSASAAAIKQAEANLAAARANFEHSIIRAPISGTINSLTLKLGDYVQTGSPVLTVANNNALEVITYVTESDAHELSVGSTAQLEGGVQGTITRIAPALDPITKKIEVRIGVTSGADKLTNGQGVTITLARPQVTTTTNARITLPLSALKITADDIIVFTVDDESKLVPHSVKLGTLLGDRAEVTEGLTPDMKVVTDARGLQIGEVVVVK
ncbi:efflux RND transporter periplasmic adaptor subunit [Candidatus Parcubacteria bacterium]|nr:efflux RND transporter periplasmic adaptor subunit [Candidatus Parcubacteria bacterium]